MSQASMSQKLDAARKATREEKQKGTDFHEAYSEIPALFLALIATLKQEANDPTRLSNELGVHVNGGDRAHGQRSNRAARAYLERLQAWMNREAERGMGSGDGRQVGHIERIIYGRNASNTSSAEYAKRESA